MAWKIAVPGERGDRALTTGPILLGLLVAPSLAGVSIGAAGLLLFGRSGRSGPNQLAGGETVRHWGNERSSARTSAPTERLLWVGVLTAVAVLSAGWGWIVVTALAAPCSAVTVWSDTRRLERRANAEICRAIAISVLVASIAVAGGESPRVAVALWIVLSGRAVTTIPFIRTQVRRLRRGGAADNNTFAAQLIGIVLAHGAVAVEPAALVGALAVSAQAILQTSWLVRPVPPVSVLARRQLLAGFCIVVVTAIGILTFGR